MNWKWAAVVRPWGMIGQMSPSSRPSPSPQSQSCSGGGHPLRLISHRQKHRVTRAANTDCHLNVGVGRGRDKEVESQSWSQSAPQRLNNKKLSFRFLLCSQIVECEGRGSVQSAGGLDTFKSLGTWATARWGSAPFCSLWKWPHCFGLGIGVTLSRWG